MKGFVACALSAALRAALDQVVACAGAAPLPAEGEVSLRPSVRASPGAGVARHHDAPPAAWQCVPWLLLGALALSLALRILDADGGFDGSQSE